MTTNNMNNINIAELIFKLWDNKNLILRAMIICFVLGTIIAISIPKLYKATITLSPESSQNGNSGNLSGMASMLGINGLTNTQDAVNSSMFPDLINTTPFILEMYNIQVKPQNNKISLKLSEYITQQKKPWWDYIIGFPSIAMSKITSLFSSNKIHQNTNTNIDPFRLTQEQNSKIAAIKGALSATIDSKSSMTIVSATFQDPDVAATVVDSAVAKLQEYIIDYRTRKAQEDCDYLEKLCKERKKEYLQTQKAYANFIDANRNVIQQRTQAEGTRLQNDMNIAFQIYSQVETQLQVARAKVQEAKPVFAVVEPATVPLRADSPNRPLILIGFILLGAIGSSTWIIFIKDIWNLIKLNNKKRMQ